VRLPTYDLGTPNLLPRPPEAQGNKPVIAPWLRSSPVSRGKSRAGRNARPQPPAFGGKCSMPPAIIQSMCQVTTLSSSPDPDGIRLELVHIPG